MPRTASLVVALIITGLMAIPALLHGQGKSENIGLLSHLTLNQLGSDFATDCWGYTSSSGREYAIICLRDKTSVVEISNPAAPVIIGSVSHQADSTGDVKVYLDYAYAANGGGGGIDIIDLSDVDNGNVSLVQRMTTGGVQWVHNIAINEDSGYLYLGIGNINGGDIVAYNLADPEDPFVDGEYNGERSHDLQVITYTEGPYAGREIAFSFSESVGMEIIDVTDKDNMFLRSSSTYPNTAYCHQGWVSEDRQFLYLNDELDGIQQTTVFDINDLDNPVFLNNFSATTNATDHNLYVRDGFIFEANYTSGLRVFDARTDPVNPPEVGFYDTHPDQGKGFSGAWSNYPFFPSGNVIVSDRSGGLFVLDVSAITGETVVDVVADDFSVFRGIQISGNLTDVYDSDDSYLKFNPGFTLNSNEPPVWIVFEGTLASDDPTAMAITVEANANTPGLTQTIEIFNYVSGQFEQVDARAVSFNKDAVVIIDLTTNIADYVESGTGAVRARTGWRPTSAVLLYPWTACIDQVIWTVTQ